MPNADWLCGHALRQANAHWSGYLLLGIYAASQVLSSWFMSGQMEKAQRYVMMVVPLMYAVAAIPALVALWMIVHPHRRAIPRLAPAE